MASAQTPAVRKNGTGGSTFRAIERHDTSAAAYRRRGTRASTARGRSKMRRCNPQMDTGNAAGRRSIRGMQTISGYLPGDATGDGLEDGNAALSAGVL